VEQIVIGKVFINICNISSSFSSYWNRKYPS